MSKFTKEMVDDYANKLLIGLTQEENDMVLKEFDVIEQSMEKIANIPGIDQVQVMSYALDDFVYELRSDDEGKDANTNELLQNCSSVEDDFVSVPKVVG